MSQRKPSSDNDIQLFRDSVGKVRPVTSKRAPALDKRPAPLKPSFHRADEERVMSDAFSDEYLPVDWETGEEISFFRQGLQHRVRKRLKQGQYPIQAELDLHGMTVPVARRALSTFLHECINARITSVRVIHGKGRGSLGRQPILKQKVNHWLRQWDSVLACCTARPVDGGSGAVYVLLRNRR